jgi:hypothetical protein
MKNRGLIILTAIFFLLVNTTYYWEGKLGAFAMLSTLLLVTVFFGLLVALLRQIFLTIKEKFRDRNRFLLVVLLTIVLGLTYFRPFGLVDWSQSVSSSYAL